MPAQNPVNPPILNSSVHALADFRDWLMAGGNPNMTIGDSPLLLWLLEQSAFAAIPEAWAAGANPDARDSRGRNWLHRAIALQAPSWLAMEGFRRQGAGWWEPDEDGKTPLHLPLVDPRLAQAIIARWWSERRPRRLLGQPFDPLEAAMPQSRAWRAWSDLLLP